MAPLERFTHGLRVVVKTRKSGRAQRRFVHGKVTTNAIVTHRKPLLLTERSLLESRLSRQYPRLLILRPEALVRGFHR